MNAPVIRIAGAADGPALAALRRAWTAEWNPGDDGADDPGFEARFLDWYEREAARRVTWLAEVSGEPAGMVNLTLFERMPQPGRDPGSWGDLGDAYVLPAHRDQGIGSRLLRALLDYTHGHRYVRVVLNPSQRSGPFYRRLGFSPEHGLLVRRCPALRPGRQRCQRSPWYSAGGPSCAPMTGSNAAR